MVSSCSEAIHVASAVDDTAAESAGAGFAWSCTRAKDPSASCILNEQCQPPSPSAVLASVESPRNIGADRSAGWIRAENAAAAALESTASTSPVRRRAARLMNVQRQADAVAAAAGCAIATSLEAAAIAVHAEEEEGAAADVAVASVASATSVSLPLSPLSSACVCPSVWVWMRRIGVGSVSSHDAFIAALGVAQDSVLESGNAGERRGGGRSGRRREGGPVGGGKREPSFARRRRARWPTAIVVRAVPDRCSYNEQHFC